MCVCRWASLDGRVSSISAVTCVCVCASLCVCCSTLSSQMQKVVPIWLWVSGITKECASLREEKKMLPFFPFCFHCVRVCEYGSHSFRLVSLVRSRSLGRVYFETMMMITIIMPHQYMDGIRYINTFTKAAIASVDDREQQQNTKIINRYSWLLALALALLPAHSPLHGCHVVIPLFHSAGISTENYCTQ